MGGITSRGATTVERSHNTYKILIEVRCPYPRISYHSPVNLIFSPPGSPQAHACFPVSGEYETFIGSFLSRFSTTGNLGREDDWHGVVGGLYTGRSLGQQTRPPSPPFLPALCPALRDLPSPPPPPLLFTLLWHCSLYNFLCDEYYFFIVVVRVLTL